MASNLGRYREDLEKIIDLGKKMETDLIYQLGQSKKIKTEPNKEVIENRKSFEGNYQRWYTEAFTVIKQLLPYRLQEFELLYKADVKRKEINIHTYVLSDWLLGYRSNSRYTGEKLFDDLGVAIMKYQMQLSILKSVEGRFESSLFEIRQVVAADLYDSELESAKDLCKKGFLRGAGVIAGVILEKHLFIVCENHNIIVRKKDPSIGDFNDLLKNEGAIDVPTWRFIQRLGDIRNICGHNKTQEPKEEEVSELIDGVERVTKTVF